MNKRAFVKYKLEVQGKNLIDLAELLDIHRSSVYKKLEGKYAINPEEQKKINEFLNLTKDEQKKLWQSK